MGKLITKGVARMEVEYDQMTLKLTFRASEKTTRDAIKKVAEHCESFLERLKEIGINTSSARAGDNSVERNHFRDEDNVTAERELTIKSEYDLELVDVVMNVIAEGSYNAFLDVDNEIGDVSGYKEELIQKASKAARDKAELIATATNTKIIGIDKIKVERDADYIFKGIDTSDEESHTVFEKERKLSYYGSTPQSSYSELKNEITELSQEVYIEWILEDN